MGFAEPPSHPLISQNQKLAYPPRHKNQKKANPPSSPGQKSYFIALQFLEESSIIGFFLQFEIILTSVK